MQIQILQNIDGAKEAKGLTVIIDVFRAFSTACYIFNTGIERIIPVEKVEDAFYLKEKFPEAILLGERHERKVEGFDFGNSPTHIYELDLKGKTLIMTTSSGTRGIANATQADEIITGSFVNAGAIVRHIRKKSPAVVSLACMGYEGHTPTQEDTFLAEYVKAKLMGNDIDFEQIKAMLRVGDGARLLNPANHEWSPATDFDLCLDLDRFDFVLGIKNENGINILRKL